MSEDARPIGVFDSGIGGLTVLKELLYQFPTENFLYLGDTARLPYGSKSPETIRRYSLQNVDFLMGQKVKAAVIACNSASTQMPETEYKQIPVYNVIRPGAATAVAVTRTGKIGLLGTRATVLSKAYENEILKISPSAEVRALACPLFVPLAEEGWIDDPITNLIVYRYLQKLMEHPVDTLILGCTHYPILKNAILRVTGSDIQLVDSGEAIAKNLHDDFLSNRIAKNKTRAAVDIRVTDGSDHFVGLAKKILQPFVVSQFHLVNV